MRTTLYRKVSGHLGQYEDDWIYVDEDGEQYVLHEYDHVRVNGGGASVGENRIEIEYFLKTGHHSAVERLKQILGK